MNLLLGNTETLDVSADAYSAWIAVPANVSHTMFEFYLDNTDAVGVIQIQGCINIDHPRNLPFIESDGSYNSSGIAVASGTDVDTEAKVGNGLSHLRVFYDRTSGGSAQSLVVYVNHVKA